MLATLKNMQRVHSRNDGTFAFSPTTLEEYSADPGDYFLMTPNETLKDRNGHSMLLVRRETKIVPITFE